MGTLAILGVGLIGGSYGLAAKERGLASRVVGWVRSERTAEAALRRGAVDGATYSVREAVAEAELVVLCTPPATIPELAREVAAWAPAGAVVTDAASVKGDLVAACEPLFGAPSRFVGGHPMAGSERGGVANASARLFEGAAYVVTPTAQSDPAAIGAVSAFARGLGARVVALWPEEHDRAVARASHLPHLAASAVARAAIACERARLVHGAGLRDTTRVAEGDPSLWTEILLANREALALPLAELIEDLSTFAALVAEGDEEAVRAWLARAADLRAALGAEPTRAPREE